MKQEGSPGKTPVAMRVSSEESTNAEKEIKYAMITDEDLNCQQNQAVNYRVNSLF